VVVTTGAISRAKLQSNHHHQKKPTPSFLQAGCSSCRPTNNVEALKGKISHSLDLFTPSSPGGLPTLSLTTNSSWLPWVGLPCLSISPLMPVPQKSSPNKQQKTYARTDRAYFSRLLLHPARKWSASILHTVSTVSDKMHSKETWER